MSKVVNMSVIDKSRKHAELVLESLNDREKTRECCNKFYS